MTSTTYTFVFIPGHFLHIAARDIAEVQLNGWRKRYAKKQRPK